MKINFKKISAIAASVLLAGMTMGVAAAANYPQPFVDGNVADVAIVYGTGTGVNMLDEVEAGQISNDLSGELTGDVTAVSGGETFTLEKTSDYFNFNDNLASVYDDLGDDEMDFLADGTYDDGDIDEDYSQKINLHTNGILTLFTESDYNDKEPTLGFHYDEGEEILNYIMEFDSTISMEDMEDTDVPLFGKEYYVLDVVNGTTGATLTLLDSAEKNVLSEGESVVVNGKTVSIAYIEDGEVKFDIDGEITDTMVDNDYEELADESYIVATDILWTSKETGVSKVEFSIGAGKMVLEDTKEIEVNDERVDDLYCDFDITNDDLTSITITWKADDNLFLTEENALTMPLFGAVSLVFDGMTFPSDSEIISFSSGDHLTLEMDNFEIELMTAETAAAIYMGEDGNRLVTKSETLGANYTNGYDNITELTGGLHLEKDDRFIVTILDEDLSDIDQIYYEVSDIDYTSDSDIDLDLTDLIGSNDMAFDEIEDLDVPATENLNINVTGMNDTYVYLNFTGGVVTFNKIVSDKGLLITLPAADRDDAVTISTTLLTLEEQDDEGDVGEGLIDVSVGVSNSTNDKLYATCTDSDVTKEEEISEDDYIGYFESALATKIDTDESGDEYDLDVEYFGEEVYGTVKVVVDAEVSTTGAGLGNVVIMDTEVDKMVGVNLIVVGGSCINAVAADLLGGALCGADFTAATGVGSGKYLIKSFENPHDSGKIAVLVAGYSVTDTQAAGQYLRTQTVNTATVDMVGTTATLS